MSGEHSAAEALGTTTDNTSRPVRSRVSDAPDAALAAEKVEQARTAVGNDDAADAWLAFHSSSRASRFARSCVRTRESTASSRAARPVGSATRLTETVKCGGD